MFETEERLYFPQESSGYKAKILGIPAVFRGFSAQQTPIPVGEDNFFDFSSSPWPPNIQNAPERQSVPGRSLAKKQRFSAKLPTNRACGPVRRARRGVILNEKGVLHPFFKLFPRTLLFLLCLFR